MQKSSIYNSNLPEKKLSAQCPVCKAITARFYMQEGNIVVLQCGSCSLMFSLDRASEIDKDFVGAEQVDYAYQYEELDSINQRLAIAIIRTLEKCGVSSGSILDVGCGSAAIGKAIESSFPSLRYIGIEPSARFRNVQNHSGARMRILTPEQEGGGSPLSHRRRSFLIMCSNMFRCRLSSCSAI